MNSETKEHVCKQTQATLLRRDIYVVRTEGDNGHNDMSDKIESIVKGQPGYFGMESVRKDLGITAFYWKDLQSIKM